MLLSKTLAFVKKAVPLGLISIIVTGAIAFARIDASSQEALTAARELKADSTKRIDTLEERERHTQDIVLERLDKFEDRLDKRFDRVDERMRKLENGITSVNRTMILK